MVRFEIRNHSDPPITFLGAKTSCSCLLVDRDLPIEIPAGSRKAIALTIRAKANPGHSTARGYVDLLLGFS